MTKPVLIENIYGIWLAAYLAGYKDGASESVCDPGNSIPDDLPMGTHFRPFVTGSIPCVPGED